MGIIRDFTYVWVGNGYYLEGSHDKKLQNKFFFFFFLLLLLLLLLLLPGAEFSLIADSFALLNDPLLPFLSILDTSCPIFYLHLANVLFDVILTFVLGSSL